MGLINFYIRPDKETKELLHFIIKKLNCMSDELDQLKAAVAANTEVEESAITLLGNLSAQIIALKDDPAALLDLANSIAAEKEKLAAAITANTPAV